MRAEPAISARLPSPLLLDVTRSLRRVRHKRPSGIDRVERAYLDFTLDQRGHVLAAIGERYYRLDTKGARTFAAFLDGAGHKLDLTALLRPDRHRRMRAGEALIRRHAIASGPLAEIATGAAAYLNVGHLGLGPVEMTALGARRVTRIAMLHDLIPLEHPEFTRKDSPAEAEARLTGACLADVLLTNSADTAERVRDQALARGLPLPPLRALPLGIDPPAPRDAPAPDGAYVLCLGTIEPRKNHGLLLDLWQEGGLAADLHVAGRRGWCNAPIFERLDRRPESVFEHSDLSDGQISALIAGARALVLPSFAEGYGLPLAEALALGTPAIVSNLPALREVGRDVPEYLSPTDHEAWRRAVRDYTTDTPRRADQIARLQSWRPPLWSDHFAGLQGFLLDHIAGQRRRS